MAIRRKRFIRVPAGSTLELTVGQPAGGHLTAEVDVRRSGARVRRWASTQLVGKTVRLGLDSGDPYIVQGDVAFTSNQRATVTIRLVIRTPGGSVHSEAWELTLSGTTGTVRDFIVTIYMARSGNS